MRRRKEVIARARKRRVTTETRRHGEETNSEIRKRRPLRPKPRIVRRFLDFFLEKERSLLLFLQQMDERMAAGRWKTDENECQNTEFIKRGALSGNMWVTEDSPRRHGGAEKTRVGSRGGRRGSRIRRLPLFEGHGSGVIVIGEPSNSFATFPWRTRRHLLPFS